MRWFACEPPFLRPGNQASLPVWRITTFSGSWELGAWG